MLYQTEQAVPVIKSLDINEVPKGTISRYWLNLVTDGMGQPVQVPIIVARAVSYTHLTLPTILHV